MPADPRTPVESLIDELEWARSLALSIVRDAQLAEDAAQQAALSAIEHPPAVSMPVRPWLAAIIRNFIRQQFRASERRESRETINAKFEKQPSAHEVVERAAAHKELVNAVMRLDEPYRTTILLRFFDNLPPRKIANQMGVSPDTVQTRLSRAYEKLRKELAGTRGGREKDGTGWLATLTPLLYDPNITISSGAGSLVITIMKAKILTAAAVAAVLIGAYIYFQNNEKIPIQDTALEPPRTDVLATAGSKNSQEPVQRETARAVVPPSKPAVEMSHHNKTASAAAVITKRRGRVLDCDSRAMAGIDIVVHHSKEGDELMATTNHEGFFEFKDKSQAGELRSRSERYTTILAGSTGGNPPDGAPMLIIAPKVTYAGIVVGDDGSPLEGAEVTFALPKDFRRRFHEVLDFLNDRKWSAVTDASGRFEFPDAPEIRDATIMASMTNRAPCSIEAPSGSSFNIILKLKTPGSVNATIAGEVVDALGTPVPKASVAAENAIVYTDAKGKFYINTKAANEVVLTAVTKGYQPAVQNIKKGPEGWPSFVQLRVDRPSMAILGRIVNDSNKPLAGAHVWLQNATCLGFSPDQDARVLEDIAGGSPGSYKTTTDLKGEFKLSGLVDRTYIIEAMDRETLSIAQSLPIIAGATDVILQIPASEIYEKIEGIVVNKSGKPIPEISVEPIRMTFQLKSSESQGSHFFLSEGSHKGVKTDENGKFIIKRIAKKDVWLRVNGGMIVPKEFAIGSSDDPEKLRFVVSERIHMKIELKDPSEKIDSFSVLDAGDRTMDIHVFFGDLRTTTQVAKLSAGKSVTVAIEETARTLVLYKTETEVYNRTEVRRMPLDLKPGEITVVRP
ncbi:MAG: sigma-70 family RNA polymerase sigma factor [Planctomycetota bacterium]